MAYRFVLLLCLVFACQAQAATGIDSAVDTRCRSQPADDSADEPPGQLLITLNGPGRRGSIAVVDDVRWKQGTRLEYPLDDYTSLATARAGQDSPQLAPGEYVGRMLPAGRTHRLFRDAPEWDFGWGALILTRADDPAGECSRSVYIVHDGKVTTESARWVPSLLVDNSDLMLGTIGAMRLGELSSQSWSRVGDVADMAVRARMLQRVRVRVVAQEPPLLGWLGLQQFGGKAPAPTPAPAIRTAAPALLSAEELHAAQLTAGMNVAYLALVMQLGTSYRSAIDELTRIAAISNDAARLAALNQLSAGTEQTIALVSALAQGWKDDQEQGLIDPDPEQVEGGITLTEALRLMNLRLSALAERSPLEAWKPLETFDEGATWALPPALTPAASCQQGDLSPIDTKLPAARFNLPLPGSPVLNVQDIRARISFEPIVQGGITSYGIKVYLQLNANDLRAVHRNTARARVAEEKHTCSVRHFLRETDETVRAGNITTKAMVRQERHACTHIKYPCGVSLRGTKSCTKTMSTRLYALTMPIQGEITARVQGGDVVYASGGARVSLSMAALAGKQIMEMFDLRAAATRFSLRNGVLWNDIQVNSNRTVLHSVACNFANDIRKE